MLRFFGKIKGSEKEALMAVVKETFLFLGQDFEVNLSFISDKKMTELNLQYRGKNTTTNVLSFKNEQDEPGGDIVISRTQLAKDAQKWHLSHIKTAQLLLAHGILHLAGFEHTKEKDRAKMESAEKTIMSKLGVEIER